jgi:hypothetical protein
MLTPLYERPTSPWFYAVAESKAGKDGKDGKADFLRAAYITPEDITAAAAAGAEPLQLAKEVLDAIGNGLVEDAKACAFVTSGAMSRILPG